MLLPRHDEEDGKASSSMMTAQWKEWSSGFRKQNVLAPDAFVRDNLLFTIFKRWISKEYTHS